MTTYREVFFKKLKLKKLKIRIHNGGIFPHFKKFFWKISLSLLVFHIKCSLFKVKKWQKKSNKDFKFSSRPKTRNFSTNRYKPRGFQKSWINKLKFYDVKWVFRFTSATFFSFFLFKFWFQLTHIVSTTIHSSLLIFWYV